jgi:hypothetical protein
MNGNEYLKVGSYTPPDENGDGEVIDREFYRQGLIFKDEEAYKNYKDRPCYIPELSNAVYTGNDFLELCKDQEEFADELFYEVDWQHPETLMNDWLSNEELMECNGCGFLVDPYACNGDIECPNCGKSLKDD